MTWLIVLFGLAVFAFWMARRTSKAAQLAAVPVQAGVTTSGAPVRSGQSAVPGDNWLPIVGTQHHSAIDFLEPGELSVRLKREPANEYDANAIGAHVGRRKLGYIPRRIAARMAPLIDEAGGAVTVTGHFDGENVNIQPPTIITPPPPSALRPITPWGRFGTVVEVEGEFMHRGGIRAVYAAAGIPITEDGVEMEDVPALIVPSPDGSTYLDVLCAGQVVGYLDDTTAGTFRSAVAGLSSRGEALEASARIWSREGNLLRSRVSLRLPSPDEILPPMPLPTMPFVVLPALTSFQVTGEERHMDVLGSLVAANSPLPAVATLHSATIQRARSSVEVAQVRILDQVVGELSSVASGHVLPLVKACENAGMVPVVQAVVSGNTLKAEVAIRVAKAGEVTQQWLHEQGLAVSQDEWVLS